MTVGQPASRRTRLLPQARHRPQQPDATRTAASADTSNDVAKRLKACLNGAADLIFGGTVDRQGRLGGDRFGRITYVTLGDVSLVGAVHQVSGLDKQGL